MNRTPEEIINLFGTYALLLEKFGETSEQFLWELAAKGIIPFGVEHGIESLITATDELERLMSRNLSNER